MKFFLVVVLCVFAVAGKKILQEHKDEWAKIIKDINVMCLTEHKTDVKLVVEMIDELKFPEDKSLKCYWNCLHHKLGLIKPNGEIDIDVTIKKVNFVTKEMAMKCMDKTKHEKDKCEKTYELVKCVMEEMAV
ncbi:hypothetical protein FQR65_LT00677 [Abscondita terminalis]|nr:hypothetical protein FQR65_LT00677 [Abscondita terminalis]